MLPLDESKIKDLFENPDNHVKIKAKQLYALLLNMEIMSEIISQLVSMNWTILDCAKGAFFLTGDTPLNVFVYKGGGKAIFGGGFALQNVQIHFPLSPTRCLSISRANTPSYLRLSKSDVKEINSRCINMAERFVYAPYCSRRVQKLVRKFTSSSSVKIDQDWLAQKLENDT